MNYELTKNEAKDLLGYLKDVEEMYTNIEIEVAQQIKDLRQKLETQYKDQTKH